MNNQNIVNEIRSKVDIIELVSEYLPLTKKGQYYWGVCPFHNDKNPSMSVDPKRQTYNCWSCHASGNVFTFLQNIESISFPESLKRLADKVGIEVSGSTKSYDKVNEKSYEIYDLASKFYELMLNTPKGDNAKKYLKERLMEDDIIKEFGIGLALNDRNKLLEYLKEKKYDINTMEDLGLVNGDYDTFINRVMFPIHDRAGHVVGFSGRIYDKSDQAKYINTRETKIFRKGNILYNYHRCKEPVRVNKYVIVTEGFMDVIRLSTIGVKNALALMGTAMTSEHVSMLKKLSLNVYLCLDGDDAGINAMISNGEILEAAGINVKMIALSEGLDPDTYILKYGKERFETLIEKALNYSEYKLERLKHGVNFDSDLELTNYINKVIKETSLINDEIRREIILKKLANDTNLSYNTLEKKLNEYSLIKEEVPVIETPNRKKNDKYNKAVLEFIYYMLVDSKVIKIYEEMGIYFENQNMRYLASEIVYYYHKYGDIVIADFYTYLIEKKELLALFEYILSLNLSDICTVSIIDDYIKVINDYNVGQEIKRLKELMSRETDDLEKAKIVDMMKKLKIGEKSDD